MPYEQAIHRPHIPLDAPRYRKVTCFQVRPARAGEQVITVLSDGSVETVNTARDGDKVATSPGGEQYLIPQEEFDSGYLPCRCGGYRANRVVRAVRNLTGRRVRIAAPWSGTQVGGPDCWFVAPVDRPGAVYIVGAEEFGSTYRPDI